MKQLVIGLCYANLWVALQIALFSLPFSFQFLPPALAQKYAILVFLFSFLVYVLLRREALFSKPSNTEQPQLLWTYHNRGFMLLLVLLSIIGILVLLFWYFPIKQLIFWMPLLPLLVFYNWNFEQKRTKVNTLRKFGGLKPLVITFCVVWVAYFSPLLAGHFLVGLQQSLLAILLEALALFFFVLSLVLPFDIRDIQYDFQNGLKTIPVILGERKTRLVCMGLLTFYGSLFLLIFLLDLRPLGQIWPHWIAMIAGWALLADKGLTRESWEYLWWVDGLLGFPALLWLLF